MLDAATEDRPSAARPGGAGGSAPHARRGSSGLAGDLLKRREFGLLAAMLAVAIPVTIINPRMLSAANLTALSMDAALLIVAALAQMLVLITRNIDLSVASVIGLSAYMAGRAWFRPIRASASSSASRPACARRRSPAGLLNGLVVTWGRMPAIVVTLGIDVDLSRLQPALGRPATRSAPTRCRRPGST